MTARLGILLSGNGSTYANLAAHCASGSLDADIACVIGSKAGLGGLDRAAAFGHPQHVASRPEAVGAALKEHAVTHVAMCGWLKFWDPPEPWRATTVNVHPSLLPAFGGKGMYGLHVHQAVLAAGCRISGCTVHLVSGAYDSGPILAQAAVPVQAEDDMHRLAARVQAAERELYPRVIQALITGGLRVDEGRASLPHLERTAYGHLE